MITPAATAATVAIDGGSQRTEVGALLGARENDLTRSLNDLHMTSDFHEIIMKKKKNGSFNLSQL